MANPIHAGSLATVIGLANNPPDQPRHSSTGDLQQPLVLYIARVPGSQDVFLTTMKPQQEVVTAQDVQSSLYYIHLDMPEDKDLVDSVGNSEDLSDEEDARGKPATQNSAGGVRRKPLPPSPIIGFGDCPKPLPEVNPYFQTYSNGPTVNAYFQTYPKAPTGSLQAGRKPVGQGDMAEHRRMDALPDRKLLGPRPLNQRFFSVDNSPLHDVPEKQNIDLRRRSEQPGVTPPRLPPRPFSGGEDSVPMLPPRPLAPSLKEHLPYVANRGHSRFLHRKPIADSASHDLDGEMKDRPNSKKLQDASLSLIRRYNNEQWNVGKISSQGTKPGFGESSPGISIHIMTHGYSRFIDPINVFDKQAFTVAEKSNGTRDSHSPITAAEEQVCFQRHLQVSGHAMSRGERHRPKSTESTFSYRGTRPSFDLPRHSRQSSDSTESNRSSTNGLPELKSGSKKGYIFRSPWDGVCEFTTGVAGRSFKCKHSYASSNPRFGPGMHSAQVSELRFNLPSSKTLGSPASKNLVSGIPREAKRSSLFMHQHRRRSSSSFEAKGTHGTDSFAPKVELEERLDLSLGQEHAGGGFGGKQAKLGKLIIETEGQMMLDLIVAANIALFWRVYENFM